MELTFFNSFCRGGNLKAFWESFRLGAPVDQIKELFGQYFGNDFYGTLLSDLEALDVSLEQTRAAMD